MDVVDPDALHAARNTLRRALASHFKDVFLEIYRKQKSDAPYSPDAASMGKRALGNLALSYLMELETSDVVALCYEQFGQSNNMTEQSAALSALVNSKNASQRA